MIMWNKLHVVHAFIIAGKGEHCYQVCIIQGDFMKKNKKEYKNTKIHEEEEKKKFLFEQKSKKETMIVKFSFFL